MSKPVPSNSEPGRSIAPEFIDHETVDAAASELVGILDQYLADLKAGTAPSRAELIARHPAHARQLEACLAGLEFIHGTETAAPGRVQRLGDFRIIREVGRGGMGAVYEAEQISLGRSVALKILRFGGLSDPEAIERFKREAETVAKLHHTNIVPIFNVGTEHGVNYYAMQFIEGCSLAELFAKANGPLPANDVAEWGLQAAEALAHAHQRGVIHRDVKPSNLLLDRENRVWLTDFGLARRLEDVTLSITGALLGTPRYMSPEQAVAAHKQVDNRSDLFSLGATLYELLSGTPAFSGDSPHAVIQHILNVDPLPIRQLANGVPRDLETIVMKCLAKDPRERYATASELAADLRALLDGRPIHARRASLLERAARWMKQRRTNVKLTASAVAATLAVTIAATFGWFRYDSWRQATVKLSAVSPPLIAEFLGPDGEPLRVETIPMQNSVKFPAGDYQVRFSAAGALSETLDLRLARGQSAEFALDVRDQMLWTEREVEGAFAVFDFGDQHGLVLIREQAIGVSRRDQLLDWSREITARSLPNSDQVPGFLWSSNINDSEYSGYGCFDLRPWILPHTADIDGRGTHDLILVARHQAWVMAVAGEDGAILWFAGRGHDLTLTPPAQADFMNRGAKSTALVKPTWGPDCDGDGCPDLIVTFGDIGPQPQLIQNRYPARCWIEAISGKSGQSIWSFDIPHEWFDLPGTEEVPYDLRWFAGTPGGSMSGGRGFMNDGRHRTRDGNQVERTGPHGYRPASVELIQSQGTTRVGVVAGTHFVSLDLKTGSPDINSIDLGIRPARACGWGDLDGDRSSDLVLLEPMIVKTPGAANKAKVTAWSTSKSRSLWSRDLDATWPAQPDWTIDVPDWPLIVDLDADGKCEMVVPDGNSGSNGISGGRIGYGEIPWGTVIVLDGRTGEPHWSKRLVSMDRQIDRFLDGPDIDQDGYRELFVATLEGSTFHVHVDALSGRTGSALWTNGFSVPPDSNSSVDYHLAACQWWRSGTGGWPQFVVQLRESGSGGQHRSLTGIFSAHSGRITHRGDDIAKIDSADFDGDGCDDLLVFHSKSRTALDRGGKVNCVRGVGIERWAHLANFGEPLIDADGDGVLDLFAGWPSLSLTATSGATGEPLWESELSENAREFHVRSAQADLDGDGITDLLGWRFASPYRQTFSPLFAISGRTGRRLWNSSDVSAQLLVHVLGCSTSDLDGDGKREVIWLVESDYGYPIRDFATPNDAQLRLFVTSGETGELRWSQPLSRAYSQQSVNHSQINRLGQLVTPSIADLNQDGVADLIVPSVLDDGRNIESRALSGVDGKLLWSRAHYQAPYQQQSLENWVPPAVIHHHNEVEIIVVESTDLDAHGVKIRPHYRVVSLNGIDGSEKWNWMSDATSDSWAHIGLRKSDVLRPHILRANGNSHRISVLLSGQDQSEIVTFAAGADTNQPLHRYKTKAHTLWSVDANCDGVDELAFIDSEGLRVVDAVRLDQPLWQAALGSPAATMLSRILTVLPSDSSHAAVIVVASDATDNRVTGFDAATGARVWICPGVISRSPPAEGVYMVLENVSVLASATNTPPLVYYSYRGVSRCRQGTKLVSTSVNEAAVVKTADPPSKQAIREEIRASRPASWWRRDVRWERELPWAVSSVNFLPLIWMTLASMMFAALLIVLPLTMIVWIVRARQFSLRTLLAVPIVAGLFLTAWLIRLPGIIEASGLVHRLQLGIGFAPPVVAVALVFQWMVTNQRRRVVVWVSTSIVLGLVFATVLLVTSINYRPLMPEERFDRAGWYLIWFPAALMTTWIMIIVLPLKHLLLLVFQRRQKRKAVLIDKLPPRPDSTIAVRTNAE